MKNLKIKKIGFTPHHFNLFEKLRKRIQRRPQNGAGFTLIELLVVIAIIGILATFGSANFLTSQARTRDAQRKSDIKEIQNALELYKNSQTIPAYPANLDDLVASYIRTRPHDPKCPGGTCSDWVDYNYYRSALPVYLDYTLTACLENQSDPQRDSTLSPYCSGRPASITRYAP